MNPGDEYVDLKQQLLAASDQIDDFYENQLLSCYHRGIDEAIQTHRVLFRLACVHGHLKPMMRLCQRGYIFQTSDPGQSNGHYFNLCATHGQLEALKYLFSVCHGQHFTENLLGVDLIALYHQGAYDIFYWILDTAKYRTECHASWLSQLMDLRWYLETNYSYVYHFVNQPYLAKTHEVIQTITEMTNLPEMGEHTRLQTHLATQSGLVDEPKPDPWVPPKHRVIPESLIIYYPYG